MKYVSWITSALILAISLIGCGQNESSVGIPSASGVEVSVTSGYGGVVMVYLPNDAGFCSGVVVSQYAVLTANHCLLNAGTYTVVGAEGTFTTTRFETNGTGTVEDTQDIGMLLFSSPIVTDSQNIYGVANQISSGDTVTIVGYGCTNPNSRDGGGIKRAGSNAVTVDSDFLDLLTPVSTVRIIGDSTEAGSCFGDSGGPMFNSAGAVVGLTHAGGEDASGQNYISEYVNIATNAANHDFIKNLSNTYSLNISI